MKSEYRSSFSNIAEAPTQRLPRLQPDPSAPPQGPVRPPEQTSITLEQHATVVGNERMIALAGAVLLILILAEIVIAANLHTLMPVHIFVGVLLIFPLFLKMGSAGYRFLKYYTGSSAFIHKGPPRLEMRLLAPLLVLASLSLVTSGITLALLGPTNALSVWVLRLHALSVICWLPLLALHVGAYIWRTPRLLVADWRTRITPLVPGRSLRYGITLVTLLAGTIAAVFLFPSTASWASWEPNIPRQISTVLVAAILGAFLVGLGGLIILKPWRWTR